MSDSNSEYSTPPASPRPRPPVQRRRGRRRKVEGDISQEIANKTRCPTCKEPSVPDDYINKKKNISRLTKNCIRCRKKILASVLSKPRVSSYVKKGTRTNRLLEFQTNVKALLEHIGEANIPDEILGPVKQGLV